MKSGQDITTLELQVFVRNCMEDLGYTKYLRSYLREYNGKQLTKKIIGAVERRLRQIYKGVTVVRQSHKGDGTLNVKGNGTWLVSTWTDANGIKRTDRLKVCNDTGARVRVNTKVLESLNYDQDRIRMTANGRRSHLSNYDREKLGRIVRAIRKYSVAAEELHRLLDASMAMEDIDVLKAEFNMR